VASTSRTLLAALLAFAGAEAQQTPKSAALPERVQFNRDVRPILSENCLKCHGPDARARKADLRLDTKDGTFGALEEGRFAVVPGNLEKSELWKRITTTDSDDKMPPAKSGKKLTKQQVEVLRRWIEQGAPWQGHWAFQPLQEPPLLKPRDGSRVRNSIDQYIQARLDEENLVPSPEADRHVLARRLTLDLTGLPPTPQEVDAFVNDRSPDAYDKIVERLLQSSRTGEHLARYWLDLARYGDTHGLHLDNYREMWPYRDWVIRAFNDNMPFDRFVVSQLAGDLLPDATLDQQVASGFNRCHVTTNEGGSIEEEVYCRNVFDRVETFGQVFFALTFTCSRCHDHKYDPVTQKDYYGLFAFFNSLEGQEMDGNKKDPAPVIKVPSPDQAHELARLRDAAGKVEARVNGPVPDLDARQADWEKALAARLARQWTRVDRDGFKVSGEDTLDYVTAARAAQAGVRGFLLEILPPDPEPPAEAPLAFTLNELQVDKVKVRAIHVYAAAPDPNVKGVLDGKADTGWAVDARKRPAVVLLPAEPVALKDGAEVRLRLVRKPGQPRAVAPRLRLSASSDLELFKGVTPVSLGPWHLLGRFPAADGNVAFQTEYGPEKGVDLEKAYGELKWTKREDYQDGANLSYPEGVGASFAYRTITAPAPRKFTFNVSSDDAIQIWLNGAVVLARNVKRTFRKYDANKLTVDLDAGENKLLVKFSNYGTTKDHKYVFELIEDDANDLLRDAAAALAVYADRRSDAQKSVLRSRFRRENWEEYKTLRRELADLRGQETALLDKVPVTLVFKERANPKDAFILKRGEYDKRGEKVGRATPGLLPPFAKDLPVNRLGLAKWLIDPQHPLTARVAVNRFWQQFFGTGLVKTSEDFGLQGEPPSHPELLDHLALQFMADRWNVKNFLRRIVTSATYRQSSRVTPELVRRDPENRLLARGPRFRLDAEMVRDQILYLSGLLVEQVGGPSVKPPQPEGLWEAVGYTGSNTYRFQRDPEPQKVFRRSLYIFWKRTSAPPQMTLFDAPSREACTARRERTNTPLQALFLMNEPQCFEAARHLAQKAIKEGGGTPEERAAWMLRRCALRNPTPHDISDLVGVYRSQREAFAKDPEGAKKAISYGDLTPDASIDPAELASWTMVANLILNLDEVVTKK